MAHFHRGSHREDFTVPLAVQFQQGSRREHFPVDFLGIFGRLSSEVHRVNLHPGRLTGKSAKKCVCRSWESTALHGIVLDHFCLFSPAQSPLRIHGTFLPISSQEVTVNCSRQTFGAFLADFPVKHTGRTFTHDASLENRPNNSQKMPLKCRR